VAKHSLAIDARGGGRADVCCCVTFVDGATSHSQGGAVLVRLGRGGLFNPDGDSADLFIRGTSVANAADDDAADGKRDGLCTRT
jgi:hypothetical protein